MRGARDVSITLMAETRRSDLQVYYITTLTFSPFLFQNSPYFKVQGQARNNRSRDQLSVNTIADMLLTLP